jgi:anti-sigma B factor antagonist
MSVHDHSIDEFSIDEEQAEPGTAVLALHGDADLRSAGELRDRLTDVIRTDPRTVVLDLTDVTLLDSSALGVLLAALKDLRRRGGQLRLVAPGAEVRRIFEVTLLDRVFELDWSRAAALRADGDGGLRVGTR